MEKTKKECVLRDGPCTDCGECDMCDLNPLKVCDNCGKCIEMDDVASIKIDKIYTDPKEYHEN